MCLCNPWTFKWWNNWNLVMLNVVNRNSWNQLFILILDDVLSMQKVLLDWWINGWFPIKPDANFEFKLWGYYSSLYIDSLYFELKFGKNIWKITNIKLFHQLIQFNWRLFSNSSCWCNVLYFIQIFSHNILLHNGTGFIFAYPKSSVSNNILVIDDQFGRVLNGNKYMLCDRIIQSFDGLRCVPTIRWEW